jgi:hypothetical protein
MSNIKHIHPVEFWTPSGTIIAEYLMLYNFHDYDFNDSASSVSYKLMRVVEGNPEAEDGDVKYQSLFEGSVILPYDIVSDWGSDDSPIWNYVMTQLNLMEFVNNGTEDSSN